MSIWWRVVRVWCSEQPHGDVFVSQVKSWVLGEDEAHHMQVSEWEVVMARTEGRGQ